MDALISRSSAARAGLSIGEPFVAAWRDVPMAISEGDGRVHLERATIGISARWAAEPSAMPVAGDFDRNGCADIALVGGYHAGGVPWTQVPIAYSQCDETFAEGWISAADFALYASQDAHAV